MTSPADTGAEGWCVIKRSFIGMFKNIILATASTRVRPRASPDDTLAGGDPEIVAAEEKMLIIHDPLEATGECGAL